MEAINGSAGAARNSHQLEGGPSSDRHVKKLYVTFIDQEGGGGGGGGGAPSESDHMWVLNF